MTHVIGTPDGTAANRYVTTAPDEPPDLRGPDVTAAFAELFDEHARRMRRAALTARAALHPAQCW